MAARLEWKHGDLMLGQIRLAETQWTSHSKHQWRVAGFDWHETYEVADDAQQDCESEVRRLLKAAGVEVA